MVKTQTVPDAATSNEKLATQWNPPLPPRYGTKRDVAAMLQISVRTVDNLMGKNSMPFIRLGRRRCRFDMDEIRQWVSANFRTQRNAIKGGGP